MVKAKHAVDVLEKCPTGIKGLDEITKGGLPRGRPTLICGSAGCGKTLFSMEFLMRGDRLEMAHLRQGKPSAPQAKRAKKKRERSVE